MQHSNDDATALGPGAADPARLSVLGRADPAARRLSPYPHMFIENALPQPLYDELAAAFPSVDYVAGEEAAENNRVCLRGGSAIVDDPEVAPIWREFFAYHLSPAFFAEFCALWGDVVGDVHPGLEANFGRPLEAFTIGQRVSGKTKREANLGADLVLDCLFGVNTPVREPTPARGPHVDSPYKLFSCLLYLRDEADDSSGGEHQMYRVRRRMYPRSSYKKIPERYVEPAGSHPYRANTLMFWLNTSSAIHGVAPRSVTGRPRRYVAVTGECYGGAQREGFFSHHPQWNGALGRLRCRVNL